MAYVPPNRRKPKTESQKVQEMLQSPDKHFPSLGGNALVASHSTISYGGKAKEWEDKRIESEEKERIDARMAEIREERKRQEDYDRSVIMSRYTYNYEEQAEMPELEAEPAPAREEDEWTTVKRKHKKTKKDLKFDEDKPEYDNTFDHLVEADDDAAFD
jgi:hypothetical protein